MNNRLNRLRYNISGLPSHRHRDLISFLKSRPEFKNLETSIITSKSGGVYAELKITIPTIYAFRYRSYAIEAFAFMEQIYIEAEKV